MGEVMTSLITQWPPFARKRLSLAHQNMACYQMNILPWKKFQWITLLGKLRFLAFQTTACQGLAMLTWKELRPIPLPLKLHSPGCSKGSKPGFKFQNFSGDLPEDEETYDIGSDPGSPNEKPTEIVALECEESDSALRSPQEIFDFALREIRELSQCISDLNNRNVTERTHQKKCRQMRIEIEELITDTTDDQSERTRMRMALREAFAYNCPLFEWDQDIGGNHSVDRTVPKNSGKKSAAAKRRSGNTNADDDKFQNVGRNPSMKKTARRTLKKGRSLRLNLAPLTIAQSIACFRTYGLH
ncbi:uncharacterized protein LOC119461467 isoform X3 [Dermacentor silvarum]|uniref:uncharacterized protein LOC119461467 isoform X3 n=1 Tax=Dermacentor silvarum TaxID=543639 RepID=UPI0018988D42|nr:uncharacterized protein LOC119461467 isoform X3 [Dermacentor silvarum]